SKLYLYLGLLYFEQEEYVHAAANFEETTKLNPSGSIGFYWLGRSKFLIDGSLAEAQKSMARAAELNPKDSDTRLWLGRIIASSGETARAISEFEKSIETDNSNIKAYVNLVEALLLLAEDKQ